MKTYQLLFITTQNSLKCNPIRMRESSISDSNVLNTHIWSFFPFFPTFCRYRCVIVENVCVHVFLCMFYINHKMWAILPFFVNYALSKENEKIWREKNGATICFRLHCRKVACFWCVRVSVKQCQGNCWIIDTYILVPEKRERRKKGPNMMI